MYLRMWTESFINSLYKGKMKRSGEPLLFLYRKFAITIDKGNKSEYNVHTQ